jgi:uncharacterized protein YcbK (DUF882 family)
MPAYQRRDSMMPAVPPTSPPGHHRLTRRRFLHLGVLAVAATCLPCQALALERTSQRFERSLDFYNVNTGESLSTVYWMQGHYLPGALWEINYVLRDHHSDQVQPIDPQLLDLLYTIEKIMGLRAAFHILSAYRSPATNAMLRLSFAGVAEQSMHLEGKAVDVRFPGSDLQRVRRLATDLQWGGVGYYPWAGFVHLDTGPVRSW